MRIALWAGVQVGALSVAFLHAPLAAAFPPGERIAVEILSAVQIGTAALLAPAFARSAATAAATVWPAVLLAGALEAIPLSASLSAAAVVSAWVVALALWTAAFRSPTARGIVAAAATLVGVGGGILAYLAVEFGTLSDPSAPGADDGWPAPLVATPTRLAWRAADAGRVEPAHAAPLAAALLLGAVAVAIRWHRGRQGRPPAVR